MIVDFLNNDFSMFRFGIGFHPKGFFIRLDFYLWGIRIKPFVNNKIKDSKPTYL